MAWLARGAPPSYPNSDPGGRRGSTLHPSSSLFGKLRLGGGETPRNTRDSHTHRPPPSLSGTGRPYTPLRLSAAAPGRILKTPGSFKFPQHGLEVPARGERCMSLSSWKLRPMNVSPCRPKASCGCSTSTRAGCSLESGSSWPAPGTRGLLDEGL